VVWAGERTAAGAFFEFGFVLGRIGAPAGTFGLLLIPGVFSAAVRPVLFGAADGVDVGPFGEIRRGPDGVNRRDTENAEGAQRSLCRRTQDFGLRIESRDHCVSVRVMEIRS
jgi:hypothetical protein